MNLPLKNIVLIAVSVQLIFCGFSHADSETLHSARIAGPLILAERPDEKPLVFAEADSSPHRITEVTSEKERERKAEFWESVGFLVLLGTTIGVASATHNSNAVIALGGTTACAGIAFQYRIFL
jgi:hypothetical protein